MQIRPALGRRVWIPAVRVGEAKLAPSCAPGPDRGNRTCVLSHQLVLVHTGPTQITLRPILQGQGNASAQPERPLRASTKPAGALQPGSAAVIAPNCRWEPTVFVGMQSQLFICRNCRYEA